jgi:hypothetical protein
MTAAIFFAKTKMGWTERVVNKHAKKDGKPFLVDDARQRLTTSSTGWRRGKSRRANRVTACLFERLATLPKAARDA